MKKEGNISIIIVIIGMVILLSISVLAAFIMKDVSFSKKDEEKLKALNLAEAGISNFLLEITKYYQGETSTLPGSPFSGEITYKNKPAGSYKINYIFKPDDFSNYGMDSYDITSTGLELNGTKRVVNVCITVGSIYNFIFSDNSVNSSETTSLQSNIYGPFLTNGSLDLNALIGFYKGPLLISGNIIPGESTRIGTSAEPAGLFLNSEQKDVPGDIKNFKDYCQNFEIYIENFKKEPIKIKNLQIDETYIKEVLSTGAATVKGNLLITKKEIKPYPENQSLNNYMKLENEVLKISGNIVVEGDIVFGSKEEIQNIIYEGKGNLISKGEILNYARLMPNNFSSNFFPENNLLVLTALKDISFLSTTLKNFSLEEPDAVCAAIAQNRILMENNESVRGLLSAKDIFVNNNTKIYYEAGICKALPEGVPRASFIIFNKSWQELSLISE